jgi:integral membrane sensor domain MASE1
VEDTSAEPGRSGTNRDAVVVILRILIAAAAYYAAAELGLRLAAVHGHIAPLWLPIGVAIVCLLLFGPWTCAGIALAAFVVNLPLGPSIPAVAMIAVGDTIAPLCAYLLLGRAGFHLELDRLRDAVALIFLGAFGSTMISATVGATALVFGGGVPAGQSWQTWSVWWTGDMMGVLVVVPFLLVLRTARFRDLSAVRWLELAALIAGTLVLAVAVTANSYDLLFLVFPPLIWAALRFGHTGAVPCVLIVALAAAMAATRGVGPFAHHGVFGRLVTLQTFNSAVALTALLLATMVSERDSARRAIDRVAADLTKMTDDLDHGQRTLKGMGLDLMRAQRPPADGITGGNADTADRTRRRAVGGDGDPPA